MALTDEERKERKRLWSKNNKDKIKISGKKYYEKNRASCLKGCKLRYKKRAESDPVFMEANRIKSREYYAAMKEDPVFKIKRTQATTSYRNANREQLIEKQKVRHSENKSTPGYLVGIRKMQRKSEHKSIESLSDSYIKKRICHKTGLMSSHIPQELIDLKRQQIILYRTIKEIRKCRQ